MSEKLPSWDELKIRAESYFKMAEVAIKSGEHSLIQNALENMHKELYLWIKESLLE